MATLKDVAKRAGLAVGTVSGYLNGRQLKPKNQAAIELAIAELGYEVDTIARSMKTGRTMLVAVIVPNLANMFSMKVIESIERVLQEREYCVIVSDCGGDERKELERIEYFRHRQVDGMVLMPSGSSASRVAEAAVKTPLVLIDRLLDAPCFDSVIIDNEEMAYANVKKLLDAGVRRIGIIEGPEGISTARQRREGYERALKEHEIDKSCAVRCSEYSYAEGANAMKQLEQEELEAVFACNYELAAGAVMANVNPELKILGFDVFELPIRYQENYRGIQQPIEKIGAMAARTLLDRMTSPDKPVDNIVIQSD